MSKARSMLQPRLNYWSLAPAVPGKLLEATALVDESGLERRLLHLVTIRASQVNGCAFCLEMHTREAREDGESEERLYALSAWEDSPLFNARTRGLGLDRGGDARERRARLGDGLGARSFALRRGRVDMADLRRRADQHVESPGDRLQTRPRILEEAQARRLEPFRPAAGLFRYLILPG